MKTNRKNYPAECEYTPPKVDHVEITVESGFVLSGGIEDVGKDDEIEF